MPDKFFEGGCMHRLYENFPEGGPAQPRVRFLLLAYMKFDNNAAAAHRWIEDCSQDEFDRMKMIAELDDSEYIGNISFKVEE